MSACRSDFHGAFGVFLPLYMRKIQIRCIRLGKGKSITFLMIGCNLRAARKVCDNLLHGMNGIDCHSFYQSRFFCIFKGNEGNGNATAQSIIQHGQNAVDRTHRPIQRKLPCNEGILYFFCGKKIAGRKNSQCDG